MEQWHPTLSAFGTVTKADEHTYCVEVIRDSKFRSVMVILAGIERSGTARWTEISEEQMRDVQAAANQPEPQCEVDPAPGGGASAGTASHLLVEEQPARRRMTASERRALKAAEIQRFVQQYGRAACPGFTNDRSYDRELEQKIKPMPPDDLDRLLREDED